MCRALTDPDLYAQWMGPEGSNVTVVEMDPTVGGRFAFTVRLPGEGPEVGLHGTYREIDAPHRLSTPGRWKGTTTSPP